MTYSNEVDSGHGDAQEVEGGPAKVKPTLLATFECTGKIQ